MLGNLPKQVKRELPSSEAGNLETVEVMRKIAREQCSDPKVRQLALNIVQMAGVRSQYHLDEAIAIGEYVKENVRYVRDIEGMEQLHSPLYMIEKLQEGRAQGDCDDMALLIATLLLSIGARPGFCIVKFKKNSETFNHIYVVVYDSNWKQPGQRLAIDAIIKDEDIGYEVPFASKREIPV